MKEILLLEDDADLGRGIKIALSTSDVSVTHCDTLKKARNILSSKIFDLLILDVNLPDGNGIDLLKEEKEAHSEIPVILLTANDMEIDVVTGLEAGADDYITKPFSLAILRARVNTQLKRSAVKKENIISTGPYTFDFEHLVYRKNGSLVELSHTEQKLLKILVENRGHAVSRASMVDRIWTDGAEYVDENALTVAVKRLRAKLEDDPAKPVYLKTVYGVGYTWAVRV
jgi:DNA-binding response OmpR family regulator